MGNSASIYLTFDVEWANDEILSYCIDLCDQLEVQATFFATHATAVLERLKNRPEYELGIHPNFNPLFAQDESARSPEEIVMELKRIVPEALSVRSHCVTQSAGILDLFAKYGFTHDVNTWVPHWSNIGLKPWRDKNNLIRVPFFWADDDHSTGQDTVSASDMLDQEGLRVFCFHPIHIYLNTCRYSTYEKSKPYCNDMDRLQKYRHESTVQGTRIFLEELVRDAKSRNLELGLIKEITSD